MAVYLILPLLRVRLGLLLEGYHPQELQLHSMFHKFHIHFLYLVVSMTLKFSHSFLSTFPRISHLVLLLNLLVPGRCLVIVPLGHVHHGTHHLSSGPQVYKSQRGNVDFTSIQEIKAWQQWCMPFIPALGSQSQEDL